MTTSFDYLKILLKSRTIRAYHFWITRAQYIKIKGKYTRQNAIVSDPLRYLGNGACANSVYQALSPPSQRAWDQGYHGGMTFSLIRPLQYELEFKPGYAQ